jgi:hypothetical protein
LSSNFCIFRNTTCNVSQWSNATENCLRQARFHLLVTTENWTQFALVDKWFLAT